MTIIVFVVGAFICSNKKKLILMHRARNFKIKSVSLGTVG